MSIMFNCFHFFIGAPAAAADKKEEKKEEKKKEESEESDDDMGFSKFASHALIFFVYY